MNGMPIISNDLRSSCRALLLQSHMGGGSGKGIKCWEYPDEWLPLPDPQENEIYCLVTISSMRAIYTPDENNENSGGDIEIQGVSDKFVADWGDGTNSSSDHKSVHTYTYGTGHRLASGAEQFIAKVTVSGNNKVNFIYGNERNYSGTVAIKAHTSAMRLENTSYMNFLEGSVQNTIKYIKFFGNISLLNKPNLLNFPYGMKKVEFEQQPDFALPQNFFNGFYSLESLDLPLVTEVANYSVVNLYSLRSIHMPKLKKAGDNFFDHCYGDFLLEPIEFPELEEVGDSAFAYCTALSELRLPKLKKVGYNFCVGCANLTKLVLPADFDHSQIKGNSLLNSALI